MFKIIKVNDYETMSDKAFEVVKAVVDANPRCVLGLATGSSPVGLYERMIKDHKENGTSYKDVTTFNLDEYCGLPKSHPESYYSFMHRNLFSGLDIKEENIHIPEDGEDKEAKCKEYDRAMEHYQVDIQVLGIGSNGHIGFNEPGTSFASKTHIVTLKESTRKDNARFFNDNIDEVPTHAITMGIDTIMHAKKVIIVASGANKAKAIGAMVNGPVSEDCPASILQNHPDVVVVVDEAAGAELK